MLKSGSRLEKSLKNHYDTYKSKVFENKDIFFNHDKNLISRDLKQVTTQGQMQVQGSREPNLTPQQPVKRRCVGTAAVPSRENLNLQKKNIRIYTSGGKRKADRLGMSYDAHARRHLKKAVDIHTGTQHFKELVDRQIMSEKVNIWSVLLRLTFLDPLLQRSTYQMCSNVE